MFKYPYGDSQQLNLDWILSKLKELENQEGSQITADLEVISNALISASFSSSTAYNRSDIVFHNGKLYRANVNIPAPGESWNPAHWDEIMLGDTVSNLVTYLANLRNNQVFNSSNVPGTYTSDALNNLKSDISNLTSNKAEYLNLGNIAPADYPTRPEQIEQALNLINIYDKPVIFYYASWGRWSGIALKYTDGQNGYIIASFPGDKSTYFGYLVNGTFTVHRFADSSNDSKNMSNVSGSTVTDALNNLNGAINAKLDVFSMTTSSGTGVPTDSEIISSVALNGESKGEFVARFDLSNGNTAFTIIWTKLSSNYASGLGFGYYEESGFLLRKYQYNNGTLNTFDVYSNIKNLQTTLSTPETITLDASTMTFDSGVSFHQAAENTISRIGKFCVLTFSLKYTGITDTSAKTITNFFPMGWLPSKTYHSIVETGLGDAKAQSVIIDNNLLRIFPVNTGTTYAIGSIVYMCS